MGKRAFIISGVIIGGLLIGVMLAFVFLPQISPPQTVLPTEQTVLIESIPPPSIETPPPSQPKQLEIPKLGITTTVEHVGLDAKKNMDVPKDHNNVAWYQHGPVPGEQGNSVIAGHLDSETGPAVFYNLAQLKKGDEIRIRNAEDEVVVFRVTELADYETDKFPIDEVFGKTAERRLNLITCTGLYDKTSRNYSHRTVVFTERVS